MRCSGKLATLSRRLRKWRLEVKQMHFDNNSGLEERPSGGVTSPFVFCVKGMGENALATS